MEAEADDRLGSELGLFGKLDGRRFVLKCDGGLRNLNLLEDAGLRCGLWSWSLSG